MRAVARIICLLCFVLILTSCTKKPQPVSNVALSAIISNNYNSCSLYDPTPGYCQISCNSSVLNYSSGLTFLNCVNNALASTVQGCNGFNVANWCANSNSCSPSTANCTYNTDPSATITTQALPLSSCYYSNNCPDTYVNNPNFPSLTPATISWSQYDQTANPNNPKPSQSCNAAHGAEFYNSPNLFQLNAFSFWISDFSNQNAVSLNANSCTSFLLNNLLASQTNYQQGCQYAIPGKNLHEVSATLNLPNGAAACYYVYDPQNYSGYLGVGNQGYGTGAAPFYTCAFTDSTWLNANWGNGGGNYVQVPSEYCALSYNECNSTLENILGRTNNASNRDYMGTACSQDAFFSSPILEANYTPNIPSCYFSEYLPCMQACNAIGGGLSGLVCWLSPGGCLSGCVNESYDCQLRNHCPVPANLQ